MLERIFFRLPVKILGEIYRLKKANKEINATAIAKNTDINYSHINLVMEEAEKYGIVERKRIGRKLLISLTEKGEYICEHLESAKEALKW